MALSWDSPQECLHVAFLVVVTGGQIGFPQSKYLKIAKWKLLLPEPQKAPHGTAPSFHRLQVSRKGNPGFKGEKLNFSFFTGQRQDHIAKGRGGGRGSVAFLGKQDLPLPHPPL